MRAHLSFSWALATACAPLFSSLSVGEKHDVRLQTDCLLSQLLSGSFRTASLHEHVDGVESQVLSGSFRTASLDER